MPSEKRELDDTLPASDAPPADPIARPSARSLGTTRYQLGAELGRGGMGRVVEALDTQLGRTVALKEVLPRTGSVARRFVREIEITARLEHHGIVPLYDSGTTPDGRPFYVMRRVSGRPLDQVIAAAKDLDTRLTLLPAMLAAIDAIAHAHKRSVIHRDLKPTNILVGEDGATVVIDWGLAKVLDETDEPDIDPIIPSAADSLQTQAGSVFGTPGFMAPEQARGEELSASTDVYALGATLYQLLAGKPPMTGDSATEVIGKTLKHEVKPIDDVVEGVPPELIAIVDKSLSFDERVRYRNAGELAEDLRRFLDGRLVSAHDYTSAQRFSRFVRKHRTILGVIALSLAAVAAFAWFSVTRVLSERDAATAARRAALLDKQAAELARDRLAERNDALVITQARSLLDANPTYALAMLVELPPTSKRIGEARAVAGSALVRGAWWALQGPDVMTTRTELSGDGAQLVQSTRNGVVHVWDLDQKRLVVARPYSSTATALWAGHRVLVLSNEGPPELLDPAANTSVKIGTLIANMASAADAGDIALVVDPEGAAALLDLASGTHTPLWTGHRVVDAELAPDGSWLALADAAGIVVLDRAGKELAHRSGIEQARLVIGPRKLAAVTHKTITELVLDPTPAWSVVPLPADKMIVDAVYRGTALDILTFGGDVLGWNSGKLFSRGLQIDTITAGLRVAGDVMIATSGESKLHLLSPTMRTTLAMPTPVTRPKIVARPGAGRIVVIGDGLILGVDLDSVLPRKLPFPTATNLAFVDDTLLFAWRNMSELAWSDITGGDVTKVVTDLAASVTPIGIDGQSGRVLFREESARGIRIVMLPKGAKTGTELLTAPTGATPWATLVRGDGVIFGLGETKPDGRIFSRIGASDPRELVKLDGDIAASVTAGALDFVAISTRGELVRGNIASGALERANIAAGESMFVASDLGKRIAVVVDSRLYVWGRDILEVATFDKRISRLDILPDGTAIVGLVDRDTLAVPLVPKSTPKRLLAPSQYDPVLDADGKTLVSLTAGFQVGVLDLQSGARWSFPAAHSARPNFAISPRGRYIVQDTFEGPVAWTLPAPSDDLAAWITEQTSARIVDDVLTWPWQRKTN